MNQDIFQCLCNSRGLTSTISQILASEALTAEEKAMLYDALIDVQKAANRIQRFCNNEQK